MESSHVYRPVYDIFPFGNSIPYLSVMSSVDCRLIKHASGKGFRIWVRNYQPAQQAASSVADAAYKSQARMGAVEGFLDRTQRLALVKCWLASSQVRQGAI